MIGSKTLAVLVLLVSAAASALALGSFSPERLATREPGTMIAVGAFAVVVGTLMFRFWRLGERSRRYFRFTNEATAWDVSEGHFVGGERRRIVVGENREGEALDVSRRARHASCVLVASILGLVALDARALDQLGRASGEATSMASTYCPDVDAEPPPARDVNQPGCELVRRAFALGYTKSLGDCAPKKVDGPAGAKKPICTRRQRDEPLLHYSWRLLAEAGRSLVSTTPAAYVTKTRDEFRQQRAHLGALTRAQGEMLASAPHASHHVWTNLTDPGDGAFEDATCAARYLRLPSRPLPAPGPLQASKVFEHVVGQLLFEGTYDSAAGHCREYHVHWGAPVDACARLAANPEVYLATDGSLAQVRVTLERYRIANELVAIGGPKPTRSPPSFVSFQCYVEGAAAPPKRTPFSLAGYTFTADEAHVPPSPPKAALYVDRYDAIAGLLAPGFHYGGLLGDSPLEPKATTAGHESAFATSDYMLTRLFELESLDVYRDPAWLTTRPDLLEVYPYELHLKGYVQMFRRQYNRERGRL